MKKSVVVVNSGLVPNIIVSQLGESCIRALAEEAAQPPSVPVGQVVAFTSQPIPTQNQLGTNTTTCSQGNFVQ